MVDQIQRISQIAQADLMELALELAVEDANFWYQGGIEKLQEAHRGKWDGPYTKEEYIQKARELKKKHEGGGT